MKIQNENLEVKIKIEIQLARRLKKSYQKSDNKNPPEEYYHAIENYSCMDYSSLGVGSRM